MPVYRLQATLRFVEGRDGFAIDTIDIEAADTVSAIALAREWRPEDANLGLDALMLISPEDNMVYSLRRMETE